MTVYGEYLFAENFIAGYGIIRLTSLLCGRKPSQIRNTAGAVMCGIFSFIILFNMSKPEEVLMEILFVIFLSLFLYKPDKPAGLFRIAVVFYCVSFLLGGAAIAFIYTSGNSGVVSNGIFYIERCGYIMVALGAFMGACMVFVIVRFVRKATVRGSEIFEMTIEILGSTLNCRGKVDTGNYLKDPLSGRPVSLIENSAAVKAFGDLSENGSMRSRMHIVPYQSVGCRSSTLRAVRCDNIVIHKGDIFGGGKIYLRNALIGLYDGVFAKDDDEEEYSVLIQPELISDGSMKGA